MTNTDYEKQARDFMKATGTKMTINFAKRDLFFKDDIAFRNIYYVTISRKGRKFSFHFGDSIQATQANERLNSYYTILACLTKYKPPNTVMDFAYEYGYEYDEYDRETISKVKSTYAAVKREWANVERLFGDVIEQLREIQ